MPRAQRRNIENRRRRQLTRELMRIRRVGEERPGLTIRNPDNHTLGEMNNVCQYCYATYFESEQNTRRIYTSCCHGGKVNLPNVRSNQYVQEMFTGNTDRSKHFKNFSRNYNNALAMVSSSSKIKPNLGGPYVFIVNGQVHHSLGINQNLDDRMNSRYAQIYFYDTEQAARMRHEAPQNMGCDLTIMRELTNLLLEINPYAQAFKTMGEILRETPQDRQQNVHMVIYSDRSKDQRRYNLPTANDVAAVFRSDDGCPEGPPQFVVYPKNGVPENLAAHCSGLDPMAYPLLFPYGDEGWFRGMPQVAEQTTRHRNTVTQLQFAAHRFSVRQEFSPIIHGGKLFLQYIVDMFTRIEGERLAFIRREQSKLRAELYMNLHDAIRARAENEGARIGRQVILPKSFQGSFRNLHSNYLDAMAIVRQLGKPDLFLTFTCNPNWDEIKSNLKYSELPNMRPDLIVRVFHEKLKELLNDIRIKKIFGTVLAIIYTIEFQKRGLPHAHMLITLSNEDTLRDAETIDLAVWAEIPDQNQYPDLHEILKKHMIHGPCGILNPISPCMADGKCSKSFPKAFLEETRENVNGYPLYRRRNNGITVNVRGNKVDNRFIVPYNPYLLKKYNAHINVEICSTVKSVKYIYKYIYKGFDSASIAFRDGEIVYDEVEGYLNARWVGSVEAMWRIFEYPMHYQSHTVVNLECHLENQQRVTFLEGNEERALEPRDTKLMAWFRLNQTDQSSRDYTYCEIPKFYTWQDNGKVWRRRLRGQDKVIARLNVVSPKNVELFHLRLLLLHVKGAQSFQDVRTFGGNVYETYREAAIARGIAESSQLSRDTLQEAVLHATPNETRNLFGWLLGINVPTESANLWNEFKNYMIEDFQHQGLTEVEAYNQTLIQVEDILITHNTCCRELGLPVPIRMNRTSTPEDCQNKRIEFDELYTKANGDQKAIIDLIIQNVENTQNTSKMFYLDAPAGCGKTFIQKALLAKLKSMDMVVLPVAFTGKLNTNDFISYHLTK